jgi:hypothetical protein
MRQLLVHEDMLYSACFDAVIKKWRVSTGQLIFSVQTGGSVYTVDIFNDVLYYSIGLNSYSKFKKESGDTIEVVKGYLFRFEVWIGLSSGVRTVTVSGDLLFIGDLFGLIGQWSVSKSEIMKAFEGSNLLF